MCLYSTQISNQFLKQSQITSCHINNFNVILRRQLVEMIIFVINDYNCNKCIHAQRYLLGSGQWDFDEEALSLIKSARRFCNCKLPCKRKVHCQMQPL